MNMTSLPTTSTLAFQARIRKSPFFDAMRRHGCHSFSVYNRTYIAMGFHDPETEYRDLLNGVVLWPTSGQRQVEITGPDAERFVQLLTPRNLADLAVGQCRYVLITADDGGIVNDPVCLRLAEDHFWLSASDSDLWLYARGVNAVAGMNVAIRDPDVSVLQVQGPRSSDVMADLVGDDIRTLRYYRCREYVIDDAPTVVSRTGWSSERGYEIYLRDPRMGDRLFDHVLATGAPHGMRLGVVSQIRRIEGGMLSYGADMGLTENPFEVGLGRLVDLNKPAPFIGKQALARIAAAGPSRRLVGVSFDGPRIDDFIRPWPLRIDQEEAGRVTSLAYSPRLERTIGLCLVPIEVSSPGTGVELVTPEGLRPGVIQTLPFVPPNTVSAST